MVERVHLPASTPRARFKPSRTRPPSPSRSSLTHLQKARAIRRSVIEIFEPVSERGKAGIDELQKQAVALLSFKPLPKAVFDAQVSFNMLSQYGSEAPLSLEEIELKIDRHLASLLAASGAPMPSLRLMQAPVFHGYSISAWVEFEENPGMDSIFQALGSQPHRRPHLRITSRPLTWASRDRVASPWAPSRRIAISRARGGSGWWRIICKSWPKTLGRLYVSIWNRPGAWFMRPLPGARLVRLPCGRTSQPGAENSPHRSPYPAFGNTTVRYKLSRPSSGGHQPRADLPHALPGRQRSHAGRCRPARHGDRTTSRIPRLIDQATGRTSGAAD